VLHDPGDDPVLISPDGRKFLVVLDRGDIARNGSWVELLLGSTRSIEAASHARVVARLFSKSTARASELIKNVRWLADSRRVTFLWDDGERFARVVSFNTETRQMETLVRYSTPIVKYDISQDGHTIIFLTQTARNPAREANLKQNGFAITDQPLWSILRGDFDGWSPGAHLETFVVSRLREKPFRIHEPSGTWATPPELLQLSPDSRYAVMIRPAGEIPQRWDAYTEHLFKDVYLPPAREHPIGPNFIRRYFVIDLKTAISRPLWDAPENPLADVAWSPDGRRLVIGPTFLPVADASAIGLSGRAVADVDVGSGQFDCLPIPENSGSDYRPVRWREDGVIEISGRQEGTQESVNLYFTKSNGEWRVEKERSSPTPSSPAVRVELRQNPNTPPALYAVDSEHGSEQLIRDLNPQLRTRVTLGDVEPVHWKAADGRCWTGMIYYPVHYQTGWSYPLVIQTHGYTTREFSLDGPFTTVFAAQELANRDIAVLQVGGPDSGNENFIATPDEPVVYVSGFEGAIKHLVDLGLVDPKKVGIVGFSRTGWLVEYMLTHSSFPLAAAEVADNIDASYVQYVLESPDRRVFDEQGNGSRPYGKGIDTWAHTAPGFNADKVQTPLRMEVDGGPIDQVLTAWEMFSNLRYLEKPVELFVIPDIQHGVHILHSPRQRLASQGGTVDWFCFWLKGEEDPDPVKAAQYNRWHQLRNLYH
jgi:dipeptidyl aminopeptidase/acylaminoacyl peptidase